MTAEPNHATAEILRYDRRQQFEHELIDRKVNWLLTSQSVLFAAYALTYQPHASDLQDLRRAISLLAVALATLAVIGVLVHEVSKVVAWRKHQATEPRSPWGVVTFNTAVGALTDLAVPVVVGLAWWSLR